MRETERREARRLQDCYRFVLLNPPPPLPPPLLPPVPDAEQAACNCGRLLSSVLEVVLASFFTLNGSPSSARTEFRRSMDKNSGETVKSKAEVASEGLNILADLLSIQEPTYLRRTCRKVLDGKYFDVNPVFQLVEMFEKKIILPAVSTLSTKKPSANTAGFNLFSLESRLHSLIASLFETLPRGTSIDEINQRRFSSSTVFPSNVKSEERVREWMMAVLETIENSATPSSLISHNSTYYSLLIPLVANNPLGPLSPTSQLYVSTLLSMASEMKASFLGDPSNTSPFPSCCNAQQFISPALGTLCCRYISLMFANLGESDR